MAQSNLIGRKHEQQLLQSLLESNEAEFLAVYGRRRVGKTFLIREFFEPQTAFFELVGQKDATLAQQLESFCVAFEKRFGGGRLPRPASWREAFKTLSDAVEASKDSQKQVLFFDETPWLAGPRSGFVQALDHFWNAWAVKNRKVILIVCGSAANWMLKNLVHHKGGLHNRITSRIQLLPFNLAETEDYLKSRSIILDRKQIVELYLCIGGIPHYLRQVQRDFSAAQNIDRICFTQNGLLRDEFEKLFSSLFENSDTYVRIVRVLAKQRIGLTRDELLAKTGLTSGGGFTSMLEALEASGFISIHAPFNAKIKDAVIRLIDEFSLFHLTFIESAPRSVFHSEPGGYWLTRQQSRSFNSWAGFSFEAVCLKHIGTIKKALGIQAVSTIDSSWRYRPTSSSENGVQIDLLIERADRCYSLCEIKFSQKEFVINKAYAAQLREKKQALRQHGKTGYSVFLVMICTYGLRGNEYARELVDQVVRMEDLFAS